MDSIIQPNDKKILGFSVFFLILFTLHYGSVIFLGEINSFNKITYGIYAFSILLIFFYELYHSTWKINRLMFQIILWTTSIYILYSFLINKNFFDLSWFIGDLIVISAIIFSMLLGRVQKIQIVKEDFLDRIIFILFVILIIDFLTNIIVGSDIKIRSFARLIIVPSFYTYQFFKTKKINYLYIIITCFIMSLISNMRYAFIIMLLIFVIYTLFDYKERILSFLNLRNILISTLGIFFIVFILYQNNILQLWSFYYLFVPAFQGEYGIVNVFLGRFYEVQDAYNQHISQFNIGSIFFGNGLGASYLPNEFLKFFITDYSSEGAVSENIRRHIVHFGPMRFYFRYGLIGLGLVVYIFYKNLSHLAKSFKKQSLDLGFFFSVTLLLYLLRFVLQPIFNDPMLLLCLLGFFTYQYQNQND